MDLKDAATLIHFRELHLLPRVIFSIGAICFIGSFFIKEFILGFLGVGVIFLGCSLNFTINAFLQADVSVVRQTFDVPWGTLVQLVLSIAITYGLLFLAYYFYRHGVMPPYLQPLPNLR